MTSSGQSGVPSSQENRTYFDDPAVDQVMQVVLALSAEVWVLRDRVRAVEEQLEARGTLDRSKLEDLSTDPEVLAARSKERDAFVQAVLGSLLNAPES